MRDLTRRMCWLRAAPLLLTLAAGRPALAETTVESVRVTVGANVTVALRENPSTGYRWRLSDAESANLPIVAISDAGFEPSSGPAPIGAPGVRRWRIEGLRTGSARAVFLYARPWEQGPPVHRHELTIEVAPP